PSTRHCRSTRPLPWAGPPLSLVRSNAAASHRSDHVHEYPVALEAHIRQIFGEIRKVVSQPGFHVFAEVAIERDEGSGTCLVEVGHLERSTLDHALPLLAEVPVDTHDVELCRVVEELRAHPLEARLSQPVGVFSADRPLPGQVIAHVDGCDVTLLD